MKVALFAALTLVSLALLAACAGGEETPGPTVTATAPADVCQPNPDPASPDVNEVDSPSAGDPLTSPVTVSGRIAAFEAQFRITIYDAAGDAIAEVPAMSEEGMTLAPFSKTVPFTVTEETPACIWVYEASARDGSPIHVVQIPVTLEPGGDSEVCQPNPDPATPEFQVIEVPSPGDTVTSPVSIRGLVLAFEATYQVGIFDAAGDPIVETFGTAEAADAGELAPFSIDVAFDVDEETPACIWVYEASAMDGRPIHVGQIPVTLLP